MHVAVIAATAALAGRLFGHDTGVISGALLFVAGPRGALVPETRGLGLEAVEALWRPRTPPVIPADGRAR